ncbi:MAG TPA: Zn-dependent hydrolase [Bacteroidales bacterium]|nr:Zn-dependent hydrolase [Bacteroidales bacterium]HQI69248.1 Zn-dependent hydrolase [Bacteroidales bacterium]
MKKSIVLLCVIAFASFVIQGCGGSKKNEKAMTKEDSIMRTKVNEYATVKLTYDLSKLTDKEKQLVSVLIDIAKIMDDLYWKQTLGDKQSFLDGINNDYEKKFAMINYGPWDRLDDNKPFIAKYGEKPAGANFYPKDITKVEFEKFDSKDKTSLYTVIRRNEDKSLKAVWYHDEYKAELQKASDLLKKAAGLAEDEGLKKYLELRAEALITSNYQPSDMAWMDMKNNHIDFVVGPIENYEDAMYEYKTAFESFVLIKDMDWSKKLDKYISMLPDIQKQLPVEDKYKKEVPGTSSDLGVYDAIYYAGDCNAGSKTIAINLPNDEQVQLAKGSRRLQLKNTMKAKFDNIMVPIAQKLTDPAQLKNVKFDAFFNNVMFHEVAHGLGIKNTINGKGTVREALKDEYSALEEAKADILGLFIVTYLIDKGEIKDITAEDCFITFMAGIFRSVRFGAASAHGKANMMCFNFFEKAGAFTRNEKGFYTVDVAKMNEAMNQWAKTILVFQGNGDYEGVAAYRKANAMVNSQLQKELDGLKSANIPKDVVFEQGKDVLGL